MTRLFLLLLSLANLFVSVPLASAGTLETSGVIAVSFEDHGKEQPCTGLLVQLRLPGHTLNPIHTETGFVVPNRLKHLSDSEARNTKVDVAVTCNGFSLYFPDVYGTWFVNVDWKICIDYPPFKHDQRIPENGAWVSYLGTEPHSGDGVEMQISHPDLLPGKREQLLEEQPTATNGRARDIAYALAVYKENSEKNRDYLLELLRSCNARPKGSSQDDVCDDDLLEYVINLYWRGDVTLLPTLLELADKHDDIGDIETFYADLLDRQPKTALNGLRVLDPQHQQLVCKLASDSLGNVPQLGRIEKFLRASTDEVANHCLQGLR